jgi:hypothetical protein
MHFVGGLLYAAILPMQNSYKTATGTAGTLAEGYLMLMLSVQKMAHPQKGEPLIFKSDNVIISLY